MYLRKKSAKKPSTFSCTQKGRIKIKPYLANWDGSAPASQWRYGSCCVDGGGDGKLRENLAPNFGGNFVN